MYIFLVYIHNYKQIYFFKNETPVRGSNSLLPFVGQVQNSIPNQNKQLAPSVVVPGIHDFESKPFVRQVPNTRDVQVSS